MTTVIFTFFKIDYFSAGGEQWSMVMNCYDQIDRCSWTYAGAVRHFHTLTRTHSSSLVYLFNGEKTVVKLKLVYKMRINVKIKKVINEN